MIHIYIEFVHVSQKIKHIMFDIITSHIPLPSDLHIFLSEKVNIHNTYYILTLIKEKSFKTEASIW